MSGVVTSEAFNVPVASKLSVIVTPVLLIGVIAPTEPVATKLVVIGTIIVVASINFLFYLLFQS